MAETACLDETLAAGLIAGELAPAEAEQARRHAAACRDCERFIAALARVEVSSAPTTIPQATAGDGELHRGAIVGRFLVLGRIGAGGMGTVYAAYDPELDRRVALKVLRDGGRADEVRGRLLREAQAAARLSHPNVVSVFDIGVHEGRVYFAMEHVDGVTLAEWLRTERRWQDIVDVFVQAGRGIAAAHEVGVVHRDFKPDNVLVGRDQRARVVDFGLARAVQCEVSADGADDADLDETLPSGRGVSGERLTRSGALLGTPRYMAPEQFSGAETTPATDQFGFCVALYQALYGTAPFRGDRISEIATRVLAGEVSPPAASPGPAGLRRAIVRGLAVDPARRHPSMSALLRELEAARTVPRRRAMVAIAAGAAAVVAVGAVAVTLAARRGDGPPSPCAAAGEQLAGAWDAGRAQQIATAFRATRAPYGGDAADRVVAQLDRYGRAWTAMYSEACRATHELGKQSEHALDLRMTCLDRRRASVQALVDVLITADRGVVVRAVEAVAELEPIDRCGDLDALSAAVPPPSNPVMRGRVDAVTASIAEAHAQLRAGAYLRGLAIARRSVAEATATGHAPLEGEAHLAVARLEDAVGQLQPSVRSLDAALRAAAQSRDADLVARVWIEMVRAIGHAQGQLRDVEPLIKAADVAVVRAGSTPSLQADYEQAHGAIAMEAADPARARRHFETALRIQERVANDPRIATLLNSIGSTYTRQREYDKARPFILRSLELRREVLGAHHPEVADSLNNLGALDLMRGDLAGATDAMTGALAIRKAALGAEHADVARSLANLGMVLRKRGDVPQAIALHQESLAILKTAVGPRHPSVAAALNLLADDYKAVPDHARAAAAYREAIAILVEADGAGHARVAEARGRLGMSLAALGDHKGAITELEAWLAGAEKLGADHADLVAPLAMLGGVLVDAGESARAIALLERALAMKTTHGKALASARFHLGRALWDREPTRAHTLVDAARAEFKSSPFGDDGVAEVDAWLRRPVTRDRERTR